MARIYGFEGSGTLVSPQPGESIPDQEARELADALGRAVREDLGEHSVMADFAGLLRGGDVSVEEG